MKDDVSKTGPTVSVIMPTYQREEAIGRAIRSVLGQRGLGRSAIEIVVVDDGSTDHTEQVVKAIEVPPPHRIVYEKLEHIGQPGLVRNEGLAIAKGDYIGYCDSDDIWLPHHLATCLRQFALYPDSVMVETWWSFQTREKSLDRWKIEYQKASTDGRTTTTNSRLHRRDVLTRSGVFGDLRWGEDIDLWTRIGFVGPIRRIKIPTTAHAYTRGGDNLTFEFCPDIGHAYDAFTDQSAPHLVRAAEEASRALHAPIQERDPRVLNLAAGSSVKGIISTDLTRSGTVSEFGVEIGTYAGAASGHLRIELVAGDRRTSGQATLDGASDNAIFKVKLAPPLQVNAGEQVHYTIAHPDGSDVALWLWPPSKPELQIEPRHLGGGHAVRWVLQYATGGLASPVRAAQSAPPAAVAAPPAALAAPPADPPTMRQVARRAVARVLPASIKQNPTFRRTAFWVIDKLRPRP
jgi:hypothetical protein